MKRRRQRLLNCAIFAMEKSLKPAAQLKGKYSRLFAFIRGSNPFIDKAALYNP
jgi:hypothetical protein